MVRNFICKTGTMACLLLFGFSMVQGRSLPSARPSPVQPTAASPAYCNTYHNVGRIALAVSNDGTFANTLLSVSGSTRDCFTGDPLPTCEFPKGSQTSYCFGAALWMGAVLGRDTLVSTAADGWAVPGNEFHPDESPFGNMIYRSTIDPARPEFDGAVSEQDYIAVYADTCLACQGVSNDEIDGRTHRPLNIEVTQRTYAWSYSYAQDFVLFDYAIKNIGDSRLRKVYMGFYVDADIHDASYQEGAQDDFCGFREYQPALYMKAPCPVDSDRVNIAWTADNDGDMDQMIRNKVPHITAMRIVRTPSDSLAVSFNWWVSNTIPALDFGPQVRDIPTVPVGPRNFGTGGSGTPLGDRNKFYILRNQEFDYDQPRVATIGSLDSLWKEPPPDRVDIWATGLDTRYVLSFGPFDIEPGQTLPISMAYVAGMNFHKDVENFAKLPHNPDSWYEGVNFDSLGSNAIWADWIYDNPGVDTDSDGYAGEFTVCNLGDSSEYTWRCDTTWDSSIIPPEIMDTICWKDFDLADTVWRKGDGVPDFRGATPPPGPATYSYNGVRGLRVETGVSTVRVRWNGVLSENTADVFSRELDFEGYRVYVGRDDRRTSYAMVASYDVEDFNRYDYDPASESFKLNESPYSLDTLRCLYAPDSCADTLWHPDSYPRHHPLVVPVAGSGDDLIYYFEAQDFNRSILASDTSGIPNSPIKKTYPYAPRPGILDIDSLKILYPGDASDIFLTEEGFIKYYEYEYTLEDLLPTVPYWINVTAFDYGSPQSGLAALETNPTINPITTYALEASGQTLAPPQVMVFPNPYIISDDYSGSGFEGRGAAQGQDDERARLIHFVNLPAECTISIYSLDGDLVREIQHPNPTAPLGCPDTISEDCWDLITRNTQQAVSGMYYWTVEDREGNIEIGKLVIIL